MTRRIRLTRTVRLPDDGKMARCMKVPELGPGILFFSGGTALGGLSRTMKLYSHNTIHLVTPFDSGGSSAKLREAFGVPSVGDLRSRLMALADETVRGNPEIHALFACRLEKEADPGELARRLERMADGSHPLIAAIPDPPRQTIRAHLRSFIKEMPPGFDLRGASVGNLVLVGGYLESGRDIDSVISVLSSLVPVRGTVRPIADAALHLAAELENGARVLGQHNLTGKEVAPIPAPVRDLCLVDGLADPKPAKAEIPACVRCWIEQAELICYPMGSFYSSVVATLLPAGVGRAVRAAESPKVYIPNAGGDPEEIGMGVHDAVRALHRFVARDCGKPAPAVREVVDFVLVDSTRADYGERLDLDRIRALGVELIDVPLVTDKSRPLLDPTPLAEVLLSIA